MSSNYAADQRLCFRYMDSTNHLLPKSKFQTANHLLWLYNQFVSDLVETLKEVFSSPGPYYPSGEQ